MKIPFNRPVLMGDEQRYMADALQRGHVSGDGYYTKAVNARLCELTKSRAGLMTTSCTHAIEMTALLLGVGPGDEIIMPSFTFVSTANAFVLRGAKPVFADVRPDTLNIDERALEAAITPRTKAIVVVHYAGIGCEMDVICETARRRGLAVVEDNAHGLFGGYRGRPLGSFGAFATQSFHETKNVICGEGGALMINDEAFVERAEIIREKGTNRNRFFRGLIDKYTWVEPGSSYLPSDILAAFLWAQLEASARIQERRSAIWTGYHAGLRGWAERTGATLPTVPPDRTQAFHLFYMLLPTTEDRDGLIAHLRANEIGAVFHYVPLHTSEYGRTLGYTDGQLPVTESASERLVRLPLFNDMREDEMQRVIEAVGAFEPRARVGTA